MLIGRISKETNDIRELAVDFSTWLGSDELIGRVSTMPVELATVTPPGAWQLFPPSCTPAAAPGSPPDDTTPLEVVSAATLGGKQVQILVSQGTPGLSYLLSVIVVSNTSPRQKEIDVLVDVVDSLNVVVPPGEPPVTEIVSADTTLPVGFAGAVLVQNVTNAPITITLPSSPTLGQTITAADAAGNAGTNTIHWQGAGGTQINGIALYDFTLDFQSVIFQWAGSQWVAQSSLSNIVGTIVGTPLPSLDVTGVVTAGSLNGGALSGTTLNMSGAASVGSLNTPGALNAAAKSGVTLALTGAIADEGHAIQGATQATYSAAQIATWVFSDIAHPVNVCLDGVRGIGILTPGTTQANNGPADGGGGVDLVNGIAGYVMSQMPIGGAFPTTVAVFGMGIADVDDAAVWGANFVVTDNRGQVVTANSGRQLYGCEIDMSFTSPDSQGIGLQITGSSLSAPAGGYGIAVDGPGFGIKWPGAAFASGEGASDIGLWLMASGPAASLVDAARLQFTYYDGMSIPRVTTLRVKADADGALAYDGMFRSAALIVSTFDSAAPVTGATVSLGLHSPGMIVEPNTSLASLAVRLPPAPVHGQTVKVGFTMLITSLVWADANGVTANVVGGPPSASQGTHAEFVFSSPAGRWFIF